MQDLAYTQKLSCPVRHIFRLPVSFTELSFADSPLNVVADGKALSPDPFTDYGVQLPQILEDFHSLFCIDQLKCISRGTACLAWLFLLPSAALSKRSQLSSSLTLQLL